MNSIDFDAAIDRWMTEVVAVPVDIQQVFLEVEQGGKVLVSISAEDANRILLWLPYVGLLMSDTNMLYVVRRVQ